MAASIQSSSSGSQTDPIASSFPALENGDQLSRSDFERLYDTMPEVKKAELIEGVVIMGSPVGFRRHSKPHFNLITWLGFYQTATPGIEGGDNGSIRLDLENMPQPEVFLLILPEFGGQARISDDDFVEGGPELIVEIASSSLSHDLHAKLEVYRRNGAREYLVWRVKDRRFDWFVLREGAFVPIEPDADGLLRSEIFPGLWLDPEALIRGDMTAVFKTVQLGLGTDEHAAFVAKLQLDGSISRPDDQN
jgi:Uma2 family endonuclease